MVWHDDVTVKAQALLIATMIERLDNDLKGFWKSEYILPTDDSVGAEIELGEARD
jgi:hypothetical protein